jgi:hypothetical protein
VSVAGPAPCTTATLRTGAVMDAVAILLALVSFALMFGLIKALERI